jgi:hypothetical protein
VLTIVLPERELFDEERDEFIKLESVELKLEHSLVSLSKWESIHEKPFLDKKDKTDAEVLSYIRCMIIAPEVSENITDRFSPEDFSQIDSYINAKMTATWFTDKGAPPSREVITSELIYYWLVSFNIPFECELWHLNRLLTLIRVCNVKNQPSKKMNKADLAKRNRALNAQRKAQFNTRG